MMKKRFDIDFLREQSVRVLVQNGANEQDARIVVDSMLEADINGVTTHGIRMIYSYVHKLKKGDFSLSIPQILKSTPAYTILDGNNTMGAVAAMKAVNICKEKAKKHGIHTVFARNCNTFGPGFYYAEKIAASGMVGFVCCNSPAAMPAYNGLEPMLGTNPLAFACPSKSKGTIALDMATSIVAKSRFETARLNGDILPVGWAVDKNGKPTTDPIEAIKGFVLPMAGFKGYGIAMIIDILSGVMSGSGYLNKVNKFYSQDGKGMNVGQLFVAFDPEQIYDGDFLSDMDEYIDLLRNSKTVDGKQIAIPGDDRAKVKEMSQKHGVTLSADSVDKLEQTFGTQLKEVIC